MATGFRSSRESNKYETILLVSDTFYLNCKNVLLLFKNAAGRGIAQLVSCPPVRMLFESQWGLTPVTQCMNEGGRDYLL